MTRRFSPLLAISPGLSLFPFDWRFQPDFALLTTNLTLRLLHLDGSVQLNRAFEHL